MPRCLVFDWDKDRCQILVGNASRGGAKVERVLAWPQEEISSVRQAEEAGKTLREFLKSSGIAPAPVLICVPRQHVLLKEVCCPAVAAAEEPALVRFQAAKELLEALDDVALDYAHLAKAGAENRILVAALRKELVRAYQALCRAAGLKLLALTPRPFVLGHCLARSQKWAHDGGPEAEWSAALLLGEASAELTVLHGHTVFFSRALSDEFAVDAEVRRSLALFAAQDQGQSPQVLYLIDQNASQDVNDLDARLQAALNIPVIRPRVLGPDDSAQGANVAAAVGLLTAWGEGETRVQVNFADPKEPKPPPPPNRARWLMIGGGALVALLFLVALIQTSLANRQAQIQKAIDDKAQLELKLKGLAQEKLDLDALKEWEETSIPWIDEFYDLAASFPRNSGITLLKAQGDIVPRPAKDAKEVKDAKKLKDRPVAQIVMSGVEPAEKEQQLFHFLDRLGNEHIHAHLERSKAGPPGSGVQEFTARIELTRQPAEKYTARLPDAKSGGEP